MKYAVYSKYRSGAKRFVRLATIHCVVAGQRLALGGSAGGTRPPIWWSGCRGFHSVDIMPLVQRMNILMAIPAVKTRGIKKRVREFDAGGRNAISVHAMTSA